MSALDKLQEDPQALLWQHLQNEDAVMLGVDGYTDFFQPMAAKPDLDEEVIWFFTDRRNKQFGHISGRPDARICISNSKDHFWADIKGSIEEVQDPEAVAKKWSIDVEAWYDKGKRDSNMRLMAFVPKEAQVSVAQANPVSFGWEISKALFGNKERPEVSEQKHIRFAS